MRHLNYNHLLYFWTVLREGGVVRAAEALHVTPQTISGQIRLLEQQVGGALLERVGRRVIPTTLGQLVASYAEEIFTRGIELAQVVRGGATHGPLALSVGISDALPKLLAYRMIEPVLHLDRRVRLSCHEGPLQTLLADLAAGRADLVLSASAVPAESRVRAFSHLLGESDLSFFAAESIAGTLKRRFPASLGGARWLMPTERSAVRRSLDAWLERHQIVPDVVGEFDDSALIKAFGQAGAGVFVAPSVIEAEIARQYGVKVLGRTDELRARFYAITTERRIRHPAIVAITSSAAERPWSSRSR